MQYAVQNKILPSEAVCYALADAWPGALEKRGRDGIPLFGHDNIKSMVIAKSLICVAS